MDLGLRQLDLARQIGVWTSTINTWENHHFHPDVQHVPKIVQFLGYDPFGPPPDSFPARLKAARIASGLTRRQLAARLRVHAATLAKWERGEADPVESSRERLKALFGLSFEERT
jgi:transcriptional regulator with XRE-family HTH domain